MTRTFCDRCGSDLAGKNADLLLNGTTHRLIVVAQGPQHAMFAGGDYHLCRDCILATMVDVVKEPGPLRVALEREGLLKEER